MMVLVQSLNQVQMAAKVKMGMYAQLVVRN
jgi:hypothetical protein